MTRRVQLRARTGKIVFSLDAINLPLAVVRFLARETFIHASTRVWKFRTPVMTV